MLSASDHPNPAVLRLMPPYGTDAAKRYRNKSRPTVRRLLRLEFTAAHAQCRSRGHQIVLRMDTSLLEESFDASSMILASQFSCGAELVVQTP